MERLSRFWQWNGEGCVVRCALHLHHVTEEGDGASVVGAFSADLRHAGRRAYDYVKFARNRNRARMRQRDFRN